MWLAGGIARSRHSGCCLYANTGQWTKDDGHNGIDIDRDRIERDIESVCIKACPVSNMGRMSKAPDNAHRLRNG